MIGRMFGDLKVIKSVFPSNQESPKVIRGITTYICECICGIQIKVSISALHRGKTHCGCKTPIKEKVVKEIGFGFARNKDINDIWRNWKVTNLLDLDSEWGDYETFETDIFKLYLKKNTMIRRIDKGLPLNRENARIYRQDTLKTYIWSQGNFVEEFLGSQ